MKVAKNNILPKNLKKFVQFLACHKKLLLNIKFNLL